MSQMEHVHPQMLKQLKERAARCTELEKIAAEVVADLRSMRHSAMTDVANWLAQKLGVK